MRLRWRVLSNSEIYANRDRGAVTVRIDAHRTASAILEMEVADDYGYGWVPVEVDCRHLDKP